MAEATLLALARYNAWANRRVAGRAALLAPERLLDPAPGTAGTIAVTLAHLVDVERWFEYLVAPDVDPPEALDAGVALPALVRAMGDADAALVARCARLDPDEAGRRVVRHGYDATVEDLILQALTHSLQHRTQLAAAIDLRGVTVTRTDYIDFVAAGDVGDANASTPVEPAPDG